MDSRNITFLQTHRSFPSTIRVSKSCKLALSFTLGILLLLCFSHWARAMACEDIFASQKFVLASTNELRKVTFNDAEAYAKHEYGKRVWDLQGVADETADSRALGFVKTLKSIGPGFEKLLVDPGLLQHLDDFVAYMKIHRFEDPWEARDNFARFGVPQVEVYRGVALSDAELKQVLSEGLLSEFFRLPNPPENLRYGEVVVNRWVNLDMWISYRMTIALPFVSVTRYPEIASAMAKEYQAPGKTVHVFKSVMSEVDLIAIDDRNGIWPPRGDSSKRISSDGINFKTVAHDRKLESFVFWGIPVSSMSEVEPLPDAAYESGK